MNIPKNLKYTTSDEWIKVEGNIATLGITDYAQEQLSDVVYVEILVGVGDLVTKKTVGATIESVKAAADVNIPISGKVLEINEDLSKTPELVNNDPFDKAWMIKLEISNPAELNEFMDADSYEKFCAGRGH